jgi:hypothetical protein
VKKGEAIRKIKPDKHVEDNLIVAKYGRFAGSRAFEALRYFEMMRLCSEHEETREFIQIMGTYPFAKLTLLDGMGPFIEAIKKRDAAFFEELAELMRWMSSQNSWASPVWEAFISYIWWEQQKIRYGERKREITRKEVAEYLGEKFNDRVPDTKISMMATRCGIKLKPGKPGPSDEYRRHRRRRSPRKH